MHKTIKTSSS